MLISTLWDMFPDKVPWYWTRTLDITGFASLTELAVAFDAAWVPCETWVPCEMIEMIHQKLKVQALLVLLSTVCVQHGNRSAYGHQA